MTSSSSWHCATEEHRPVILVFANHLLVSEPSTDTYTNQPTHLGPTRAQRPSPPPPPPLFATTLEHVGYRERIYTACNMYIATHKCPPRGKREGQGVQEVTWSVSRVVVEDGQAPASWCLFPPRGQPQNTDRTVCVLALTASAFWLAGSSLLPSRLTAMYPMC